MQIEEHAYYKSKKTGEVYFVDSINVTNTTNANDGQIMVTYSKQDKSKSNYVRKIYVRETAEFSEKYELLKPVEMIRWLNRERN